MNKAQILHSDTSRSNLKCSIGTSIASNSTCPDSQYSHICVCIYIEICTSNVRQHDVGDSRSAHMLVGTVAVFEFMVVQHAIFRRQGTALSLAAVMWSMSQFQRPWCHSIDVNPAMSGTLRAMRTGIRFNRGCIVAPIMAPTKDRCLRLNMGSSSKSSMFIHIWICATRICWLYICCAPSTWALWTFTAV